MRATRVILLVAFLLSLAALADTSGGKSPREALAAGSPTGLRWVRTGGPLGGLGYDVRMRPDNPDVMYVTDAWSGVHISSDGGLTWNASNDGITTRTGPSGDAIPVFSLTIDPQNPDVIWVGTQNKRGIFRSTNGGETWVEKDNGVVEKAGISFRGFTVDPRDSNVVYAAAEIASFVWAGEARQGREFDLTRGVIYKTTDGGERWTAIWRGDNLARYIWIDPHDTNVVYVSTGIFDREAADSRAEANQPGGEGILKSADGGRTWQHSNNGLKNLYIGSLFMHPQDPDVLLAAAGNNAYRTGSGVYLTMDAGKTWQLVLSTGSTPATSVEFSTSDPKIAYAGTARAVYRSEDGGRTWELAQGGDSWGPAGIRAGVPIDFQVDPRDPKRIFANNYGGGNFVSKDGGSTWAVASQGYTGAQVHVVSVDPRDSKRVLAIGRTGPFLSIDGGITWEGLSTAPAVFAEWYAVVLDPHEPDTIMMADELQGALLRSTDAGLHWTMVFRHPEAGMGGISTWQGFKAIAFAPSDPSVVYSGMCFDCNYYPDWGEGVTSNGVWKSLDGGVTWRAASDKSIAGQNVTALCVDAKQEDLVYAGTKSAGVFKSTDGGTSWLRANQGLRVLLIRSIALDPRSGGTIYLGTEGAGVWKSVDGGGSWRSSSGGMDSEAAIRSVVVDPTNPQTLYAADIHTGVYRSMDGAKTWVKINEGLRTRAVKGLAISSDGEVLYAATEGEGVFRLDMP